MRYVSIFLILSGAALLIAGLVQPPQTRELIRLESGRTVELIAQMLPQDTSSWHMDVSQLDGKDLLVTLSFPRYIYEGGRGYVEVSVQPGDKTAGSPFDPVAFPDAVAFSARLDGSNGSVEPAGLILQTAGKAGKPAFFWNLMTTGRDPVEGRLWLYLVLNGEEGGFVDVPLLVRDFSIQVKPLAGMPLTTSRLTGAGLLLAGILIFVVKKIRLKKVKVVL